MKPLDITQRGTEIDDLEESILHFVIGQDAAVHTVVESWQMFQAGLSPEGRPVASHLFLGPTGVGKTRLCEVLPEVILGDKRALIRIDCAEFQHGHEIAKLIGSPPGYLGHRETHPALSQEALNKYHTANCQLSFILFDEIEKASDTLWNLLLAILDKATLTLGDNRKVDFSHTMIFMTSNLGSKEIEAALRGGIGFQPPKGVTDEVGASAARKRFTPEFINRLDHIITFRSLTRGHLQKILDLELSSLQMRIMRAASDKKAPPFLFTVSEEAKDRLLTDGIDPRYGARYLKRTIDKDILRPIVNLLTSKQVRSGESLQVGMERGKFHFSLSTPVTSVGAQN